MTASASGPPGTERSAWTGEPSGGLGSTECRWHRRGLGVRGGDIPALRRFAVIATHASREPKACALASLGAHFGLSSHLEVHVLELDRWRQHPDLAAPAGLLGWMRFFTEAETWPDRRRWGSPGLPAYFTNGRKGELVDNG